MRQGSKDTARVSPLLVALVALIIIGLIVNQFVWRNVEEDTPKDRMSKIEYSVANDAVTQYNIAKRQGDPIQICVQAGYVAAAYLQAKDESSYQTWKAKEAEDCKAAHAN